MNNSLKSNQKSICNIIYFCDISDRSQDGPSPNNTQKKDKGVHGKSPLFR